MFTGYDCMRILNNLDRSSKAHWEDFKMEWEGRKYCLVELLSEVF